MNDADPPLAEFDAGEGADGALHLVQMRGAALRDRRDAAASAADVDRSADGGFEFVPPIRRKVVFKNDAVDGYVLEFRTGTAHIKFECVAEAGGLVTALKYNGDNILVDSPIGPSGVQGAIVWTSPQADWGWPPPRAFNDATFDAEVDEAAMSVKLKGPTDNQTGFSLTKTFWADLGTGEVHTHVELRNEQNSTSHKVAPWFVMRVWPEGLSFWPVGRNWVAPRGQLAPMVHEENTESIRWFQHEGQQLERTHLDGGGKLFSDPAHGWLAHTDGKMLLLLRFPHVGKLHAPDENGVELYAMPSYQELEFQGAYRSVLPGKTLVWETAWCLRQMPLEMPTVAATPELVVFAKALHRWAVEKGNSVYFDDPK